MTATVFDDRICRLGEGPLWHPLRGQLFWFDILSKCLMTRQADVASSQWQFDEYVSAAGWVDSNTLLIASQTALRKFDILSGEHEPICPLEDQNPITRSNDGRADPWGGFWIGTMGINAEPDAGAIYRYFQGNAYKIFDKITISNAICFSPNRDRAYYCDTTKRKIMQIELATEDGWPVGDPSVFIDLSADGLNPDGAVVDAEGHVWNAQWGASRVARYTPGGILAAVYPIGGVQTSCPAFGGAELKTLFVTTAQHGLNGPRDGLTYTIETSITGQQEHQVNL